MGIKLGLQMYSLREAMRFDPLGTLHKAAEIGYKNLELPNHSVLGDVSLLYGKTAAEWRNQADKSSVHITGAYVTGLTPETSNETLKSLCSFYQALNAERIVIPVDYFPTRCILDEKCRFYNKLGEIAEDYGLSLFYENHYHELQMLDGNTIMDLIVEQTNPKLLHFSFNTYWLMRGLGEPLDFFKKYSSRIGSIVQEDFPLDQIDKFNMWNFKNYHPIANNIQYHSLLKGNEIENIHPVQCELFTEIGTGILKLQPIIDLANSYPNVSYVFLKQDFTRKPSEFESIRISLENYRRITGVEF